MRGKKNNRFGGKISSGRIRNSFLINCNFLSMSFKGEKAIYFFLVHKRKEKLVKIDNA